MVIIIMFVIIMFVVIIVIVIVIINIIIIIIIWRRPEAGRGPTKQNSNILIMYTAF